MKIAIIGTGIAGNVVAQGLYRAHDVTVFEANDYVGGHTNTVDVEFGGKHYAVDTGFIVFNDWTYPNFVRLLDEVNVASQPASMSLTAPIALFFCGAYWRYGFHEDGVVSALAALQHFEQGLRLEKLSLRRTG